MKIPARFAAPVFIGAAAVFAAAWLFFPRGVQTTHAAPSPTTDSILYNFEGNVVATRKGVSKPAEMDMIALKGDAFKTSPDGQLDLTAGDYAGFRVLGDAELEIVAIQQTRYVIKLSKGTLLGNIKKLPTGMLIEIETPTTIARVNESGTQFAVGVVVHPAEKNKKPEFSVSHVCKKGRMDAYVKKASAAVSVIEGRAVDVTPKDYIPSSHTATDEELAVLKQVNQVPVLVIRDDDEDE